MSVNIYTGVPRSGKTYRAVEFLLSNYGNANSDYFKKHKHLYCNIGGFNFDKFNTHLKLEGITEDDFIEKDSSFLDWKKFYYHLEKLHGMAENDISDFELIEYLKKYNLDNSLIVIDECYRYFKKTSDPVLVWFLAYHGHLGFDIILIIHRLGIMHSDYTAYTESFIHALPRSRSLSSTTFRYRTYVAPAYRKEDVSHHDTLKVDNKVFDMYKSGDLHEPKSLLKKFYPYIVLGFLFIFLMGYLFYSRVEDRIVHDDDYNVTFEDDSQVKSSSSYHEVLSFDCDSEGCFINKDEFIPYSYSLSYVNFVLQREDAELLFHETISYCQTISSTKINEQIVSYTYLFSNKVVKQYFSRWFVPFNDSFNDTSIHLQTDLVTNNDT